MWRGMGTRATPRVQKSAKRVQRAIGVRAAGFEVADDADLKSELGLALHQIMDVPEETSDRRPQAMENANRRGHDADGTLSDGP